MFADVIPVLIQVIRAEGYDAGVSTPEQYTEKAFVQVGQMGGDYDADSRADEPVIDLNVHARGYGAARRTALAVRDLMINLSATRTPGGFFFDTTHPTGPIWVANENPAITEFLITVNIRSRTRVRHMEE